MRAGVPIAPPALVVESERTCRKSVVVLELANWEELDDVVDPVLGTESDSLDNLGEGTSSER